MTHLFEQMYGNNASFEIITSYQVVDTFFVYSLHEKIEELEKHVEYEAFDKRGDVMWKDIKTECGIQDHEERWLRYADNALCMDTTDIVWSGIEEFCKLLKFPLSAHLREYFNSLFCISWVD